MLQNSLIFVDAFEFDSFKGLEKLDDFTRVVNFRNPGYSTAEAKLIAFQFYLFAVKMEPGDLVVLPWNGASCLAMGEVSMDYECEETDEGFLHIRRVSWIRLDIAQAALKPDLAFYLQCPAAVSELNAPDALRRFRHLADGDVDPGSGPTSELEVSLDISAFSLPRRAFEQICRLHKSVDFMLNNSGYYFLGRLVDALLQADGWKTKLYPGVTQRGIPTRITGLDGRLKDVYPNEADEEVEIVATRGRLGLDPPKMYVCVVKPSVEIDGDLRRSLADAMDRSQAERGLLVTWGQFSGYTREIPTTPLAGFDIWEARDIVEKVYQNHENLPVEFRVALPLQCETTESIG